MTNPLEPKKIRFEKDAVEQVGDNRRANDPDGNKAAGDSKSPGVTETDQSSEDDSPTKIK